MNTTSGRRRGDAWQPDDATATTRPRRKPQRPWPPPGLARAVELATALRDQVFGHDAAIEAIADAIATAESTPPGAGPRLVLTLAGPPDIGKRMLATRLAQQLGRSLHHLNMATFQDERGFALNGLERGYTSARPGELTRWAYDNPDGVLVVEGAELAHPVQQDILATLFSGYMVDRCGICVARAQPRPSVHPPPPPHDDERERSYHNLPDTHMLVEQVDFSQILVVFLTTACASVYDNPALVRQLGQAPEECQSLVPDALARATRVTPRLLAEMRKGTFHLLQRPGLEAIRRVARRALNDACQRLQARLGEDRLPLSAPCADVLLAALVLGLGPSVTPAKVARSIDATMLRDLQRWLATSAAPPRSLRLDASAAAQRQVQDALQDLGGESGALHELWRRAQRGALRSRTFLDGEGALRWQLEAFALETVRQATDYQMDGTGLRIERPRVRFDDIAGHEDVKARMRKILALMKNRRTLRDEIPDGLPRGMLLFGPPGTGKTLLAKALACEAGQMPFLATTGPDLRNPALTVAIFERARRLAPAIVFIDEIDALGDRDDDAAGSAAINVLLAQIDGFDSQGDPVFTVAATNHPQRLDAAIVRAGRIDCHFFVPQLDRQARRFFVSRFARLPGMQQLALERILDLTHGMSGSDLQEVLREVQMALSLVETGGAGSGAQGAALVEEKILDKRFGRRLALPGNEHELYATACHEAGHAVAARMLVPEVPVDFVSVVPRGSTLGVTVLDGEAAGRRAITAQAVHRDIVVALAGSMAEREIAGRPMAQGAENDNFNATRLARQAVTERCLDRRIGEVHLHALYGDASGSGAKKFDIEMAVAGLPQVQQAVRRWVVAGRRGARRIVHEHRATITAVARALVEHGTLDRERLEALIGSCRSEGNPGTGRREDCAGDRADR